MRRVRGNLCRTSKGRFTRCRGKATGSRRSKGHRCKKGVVKSGPRKGRCRKR